MKRSLFIVYTMLSIVVFTACEKDPAAGLAKSRTMSMHASIPNPVENIKTIWAEGDSIRLFSDNQSESNAFVAKTGGSKVSFIGKIMEGNLFFGVYPYSLNGVINGTVFSTEIPSQQPVSFFPMAGSGIRENGIEFKGVGGVLCLNMTGKGLVTSVRIEGTDNNGSPALLSGPGTINMETSFPALSMLSTANTYVDKNVNVSLSSTESKKIYIMIPPSDYQSLTIKLTGGAEETYSHIISNLNLSAEQVQIVDMDVAFTEKPKPIDPNLSAEGIANCYVVPAGGDYYFSTKLHDNTILTGDAADYLWTDVACNWINDNTEISDAVNPMDAQYIIKNISYNAAENKISFTATGNPGNAVIALYRESGGNRLIVWSWHIWVSGKTLEQMSLDWTSKNLSAKGQSLKWLDRNVGAINTLVDNIGSNGLLFQWGRKDPFIGSRILGQKTNPSGTDETTAFGELTLPVKTNSQFGSGFVVGTTLGTVAEVHKNPMTFYVASGSWATDIQATAWGDGIAPFSKFSLWLKGTDPNKNYTDGIRKGSKSNYDPCPPGYRVPTAEELWLSYASWSAVDYPAWDGNVTTQLASKTQSQTITNYSDPSIKTFLPAFGHRDQGRMDFTGYAAYYLTSTINPENTSYAFRLLVGTNVRVEGSGSTAMSRPIRCVAE